MGNYFINGQTVEYFSDLKQSLDEMEASIGDMRHALEREVTGPFCYPVLDRKVYRQGVLDEDYSEIMYRLAQLLYEVDLLRRSVIETRQDGRMPIPGKLLALNQGVGRAIETFRNMNRV